MKHSLFIEMENLRNQILDIRYVDVFKEAVLAQNLLEIAEMDKDDFNIAFAHTYLGDAYIAQNELDKTVYHLQKAEKICEKNGFYEMLLRIYNTFGIYFELYSDDLSAAQYYLQALQIEGKSNNSQLKSILYNNIAAIFGRLSNYVEAKDYYLLSSKFILSEDQSKEGIAYFQLRICSNMIDNYYRLGNFEEIRKLIELCNQSGETLGLIKDTIIVKSWALYYTIIKDYTKAQEEIVKLLSFFSFDDLHDVILANEILVYLCEASMTMKIYPLARRILDILEQNQDIKSTYTLKIQELLIQYYEVCGSENEKNLCYKKYFELATLLDRQTSEAKVKGIKNIISLNTLRLSLENENQSLSLETHLDELTNLYNRRYLNKLMSKAKLNKMIHNIGFIMIDIDYFKEFNDTYGHNFGDFALKSVGKILKESSTDSITPCRFGGDEFVCICTNSSEDEISVYINTICTKLNKLAIEHKSSHCADILTLSVGYSLKDNTNEIEFEAILNEADQAAYNSKLLGRNKCTNYIELTKGMSH